MHYSCEATSKQARYTHICHALNEILLAFRHTDLDFGGIPSTGTIDEIMFSINDPAVILSDRLEKCTTTKCKPDLVVMRRRDLLEIWDHEPNFYEHMDIQKSNKKGIQSPDKATQGKRTVWSKVLQSWELKFEKVIDSSPLHSRYELKESGGRLTESSISESLNL